MTGQVVDTEVARDFMGEVLERVSRHELAGIATRCDAKSAVFGELLADGRAATASADDLRQVLGLVFSMGRKCDTLFADVGPDRLAGAIHQLLDGDDPLPDRFEAFDHAVAPTGLGSALNDLAGELLHFTYPDRHWPWTRWMWDPRTETGSLRLVTMDEFDLSGAGRGETYMRVGQGVAFVQENAAAAGLVSLGEGPFSVDVFLASVYGIYAYTVLRMRMTQEFNKVVPDLRELVERLLGVHRFEV